MLVVASGLAARRLRPGRADPPYFVPKWDLVDTQFGILFGVPLGVEVRWQRLGPRW